VNSQPDQTTNAGGGRRATRAAASVLLLLIFSCSPSYQTPPLSPSLIQASRAPVSQLERGYVVHQAKCAKCHGFENPADYSIADLTHDIIPDMAQKSKLNLADQNAVLAYLLAVREQSAP